ncbi:YdcF family protein [Anabaena sp. CCY 9402-a]|uniref:YdcF family protein n=1 Tax=Anabaena sp. CCY 9402-a TaxID=3103867 RepID=UPI0039C61B39
MITKGASVKFLLYRLTKYWSYALIGFILSLLLLIPIRLAIAYNQTPEPQAILSLGGGMEREQAAAEIARWYPALKVWISSGDSPRLVRKIFDAEGVSRQRVYLDYRAVDTVTNFTTLVSDFKNHGIQHLFVITSDFHMRRAKAIAFIVLGSQGIAFTPVSVASNRPQEPDELIVRDVLRSLLWIFTGRTGASFSA